MKKIYFVLLTALTLVLVACGSPASQADLNATEPDSAELEAQKASTNKIKVAALKKAILVTAKAAATEQCDQDDNNPDVAEALNKLTDELLKLVPARTEEQKLSQVAGGWKQVWSDLDSSSPICISAQDIYQVVSPDGYYWNISKNIIEGSESLGLLRGKYTVQPDFLRIEFTNQAFSDVYPAKGTDLIDLAARAEKGEFTALPSSFPVGLQGNLQNTYVDDTLRIVRGEDDRPDDKPGIFVLIPASVLD
ncbi:MAG: PAP/fibrillin family protein [Trueperaceae bacterium]